jgi:uncharacterized membrane protein
MVRQLYKIAIVLILLFAIGKFVYEGDLSHVSLAPDSYFFEEIVIDAKVLPDGSMKVNEKWVVNFNGAFTRLYMNIPIDGFTELKNIQVSEAGTPYTLTERATHRPANHYAYWIDNNRYNIEWYYSARNETRTFNLSYQVMDCVRLHDDVAELYWKFIGDENPVRTKSVTINLSLPPGSDVKDIRAWGHGPLQGDVKIVSSERILFTVKNLPPETFVEGRVVFPLELIPDGRVKTGNPALAAILAEEKIWAEQANKERLMSLLEIFGGFLIGVIGLAIILGIYVTWGKRLKPELAVDYYRELPGDYSPAEAEALYNFNKYKTTAIVATLMDLARRDYLRLEPTIQEQKGLGKFFGKTQEDINIRLLKSIDSGILPHEKVLIEFLFNQVGSGSSFVSLNALTAYARKRPQANRGFWTMWKSKIDEQTLKLGFFDRSSGKAQVAMVLFAVVFFIGAFIMINLNLYYPAIGMLVCVAGAIIAGMKMKRRSQHGESQLALWKGFRRFLKDFSNLDRATLPHLILWEHYLVYAVILGVAKEVIAQLPIVYPELNDPRTRFGYNWYYTGVGGFMGAQQGQFMQSSLSNMATMAASMEKTWNTAFSTVNSALNSSGRSSSSGGGGGFSGGGGGGGGGGGRGAS